MRMKCFFEEEDFEKIVEKIDRLYTRVDDLEESDIAFLKKKIPFSGVSVVREKDGYAIYRGEENFWRLLETTENSRLSWLMFFQVRKCSLEAGFGEW